MTTHTSEGKLLFRLDVGELTSRTLAKRLGTLANRPGTLASGTLAKQLVGETTAIRKMTEDEGSVKTKQSNSMEWTNQHDTLFLREVRGSDLFETRKGSPERGKLWDEIATRLNNLSQCKFNVNKRSLRDRLNLLMSKFKAKNREEERASGISPEIQEIDTLLEELCEKEEEAKNKPSSGNKKQTLQKEKATAEEMRFKAMETMGQTQKRVEKTNGVVPAKKSRKSTGDAIGYLQKKAEEEMALKREEIELRKQEEARGSRTSEQQTKLQQDMLKIIQQQQEEQHRQQQRNQQQTLQFMQSMLNQQQQQSQAMLTLIERLAPKEKH